MKGDAEGAKRVREAVEAVTCEFNLAYKATECGHTKCSLVRIAVEAARNSERGV